MDAAREVEEIKTIVFIDSIGLEFPECEQNHKWIGYPGLTIDRLLERIADGWFDQELGEAKIVITEVGTNNLRADEEDKVVDKLFELHAIIKAVNRDLEVVIATIIPRSDEWEDKAKKVNKKLIERGREEKVKICMTNKTFLKNNQIREELYRDGLHLNSEGVKALRSTLLNFIDRHAAKQREQTE